MLKRHNYSMTSRHITVDGYDVVEKALGHARKGTVLLIHGIGVSSDYYERLAHVLADSCRVIMLDLPGYGNTKQPPRDLTLGELATVVNSYIGSNNIGAVTLCGHSMGAQIVAQAVVIEPELYRAVILISPTVNRTERKFWWQTVRLLQDTFREPFDINLTVGKNYLKMGMMSYLKVTKYMLDDKIEAWLGNITLPALIIRGGNDPIVPQKWVEVLRDATPRGTLVTIPAAPHNVQCTNPEEVAKLCVDFLRRPRE